MEFVGVLHKPWHKTVYWFRVPDRLEGKARIGSRVLCRTARGLTDGIVKVLLSDLEEKDAAMFIADQYKVNKPPLRSEIASVEEEFPIDEIKPDPELIEEFYGSGTDINNKLDEYEKNRRFEEPAQITKDHILVKGYEVFLVGKAVARKTIPVYILPPEGEENG